MNKNIPKNANHLRKLSSYINYFPIKKMLAKKKLEKDLIRNVTILRGVIRAGCKIKTCTYRGKKEVITSLE